MQWKSPKNTEKYYWTQHVQEKMHYYGLSEQKVLGVIRKPQRIETGIAENTVAVMTPVGIQKKNKKPSLWNRNFNDDGEQEKWSQEIWVMYQIHPVKSASKRGLPKAEFNRVKNQKLKDLQDKINSNKQLIIISAWRYPGVSPKNNPIPEEILRELDEIL
ncbi:MAG TPA: hypothetical protein PLB52_03875 [Candidatus Moranbacteria bacterium]|nr:hypothetical protein [Candidatus Moranbacteria bacterium]